MIKITPVCRHRTRRRGRAEETFWQIGANTGGQRMRTSHIRTRASMLSYSYVCLCVHACATCPDGRCAHAYTPSCVQASISVYFLLAQKTPLTFECRRQDTSSCSTSCETAQVRIFYTHMHARIRLPGVPHTQHPGSAKWNFFKSQKHFPRTNQCA